MGSLKLTGYAMLLLVRNHIFIFLLMVALCLPMSVMQAGINEDLEAIDAVIRLDPTPAQ